ncbi:hypothetical protein MVEN_00863900 [Mycena venus]|uniref:Uncharacterized protein n=1 Tax=Mycena venus TaxID=2733690 RepID=A0A8H6YG90_9AGAR|nr:hypothetical protein MVEN_00863900 [Mycena venus]
MFFISSLLAVVSAATILGRVNAFKGTATLAENNVGYVSCPCPAFNGPSAAYIPPALAGDNQCCQFPEITINYNGKSVSAVFSGFLTCDGCNEGQDIYLSPFAMQQLEDTANQTTLSGVIWSFD